MDFVIYIIRIPSRVCTLSACTHSNCHSSSLSISEIRSDDCRPR